MDIGKNIKSLRKIKKISQEQLSKLTGIPRTSIGRYERGEVYPNVKVLEKIAEALEIPIASITNDGKYIKAIDVEDFVNANIENLDRGILSLMTSTYRNTNNTINFETKNKIELAINILNLMNYEVKTDYKNYATIIDKSDRLKSFDVTTEVLLKFGQNINWSLDSFVEKFIKDNFS